MTSKQRYIEQMKEKARYEKKKREIYQVTPEIYSAFAIVLHSKGYNKDEIEQLFYETQVLWNESVMNGYDMIKNCKEVTGIDVEEDI